MKRTILILALALPSGAATAQERHPLLEKAIEFGVANSVVAEKCKGWSLNPTVAAQLLMAVGLAGLTDQFERIDPAEISARAERAKADGWTAEKTGPRCAEIQQTSMPNPAKPGESIPLFVQTAQ